MFCSNCGKTLRAENTACPSCGALVGDSLMYGFTSVQSVIAPGETVKAQTRFTPYTKISYSTSEESGEDDIYTQTSYRPRLAVAQEEAKAYSEEAADEATESEEVYAQEEPAPEEAAPEIYIEPLDESEMPPLEPAVQKGISPELEEYMQRVRENKGRKPSPFGLLKRREEEPEDEEEEEIEDEELPVFPEASEEKDEDAPVVRRSDKKRLKKSQREKLLLKKWGLRAAVAIVVVLLVIGGVMLVDNIVNTSQIAGVTKDFREKGIALLEQHTTDSYRKNIISLYRQDGTGAMALSQQEADNEAFTALFPQAPLENDELFLNALLTIQDGIDNVTMMDAIVQATAASGENTAMQAQSSQMWSVINYAIKRLKTCTNAEELPNIMAEAETEMATPAPEETPEPEAKYTTLSKGAQSPEVKKLQQRLYELGYFNGKRDGKFGDVTRRAVKQFQQAAGLTVDGVATSEMQEILYSEEAPRYGIKAAEAGDAEPAAAEPTDAPAEPNEG
ncbi:MAG: peptidoglycan-binding protein [Christensenellales bacterium]|jgi:hypothetical protein